MSVIYDRLLGALPSPFDTDPHPIRLLRIESPDVTIELRAAVLTVTVADVTTRLSLNGTLGDLLVGLQSAHVDAILLDPAYRQRSARLLLDFPPFVTTGVSPQNDLFGFNNLLWLLLRPFGAALDDREGRITDALRQMNLLTAEGSWADLWGRYLGIRRKPGEPDATYTQRMHDETIRARLNNQALEQILITDLGLVAPHIEDLLPLVLIWNETNWQSYWPGNVYTSGAFRVSYRDTGIPSAAVIALINKHRAAGTRFILHCEQQFRGQVELVGSMLYGPSKVWDLRHRGLISRTRLDISGTVVEVAVPRRQRWMPGKTAMPGSIITF